MTESPAERSGDGKEVKLFGADNSGSLHFVQCAPDGRFCTRGCETPRTGLDQSKFICYTEGR